MVRMIDEWMANRLTKLFDNGWRIERTSCSCGGNWAWLEPTDNHYKITCHGTHRMFGCVCHHYPPLEGNNEKR